MGKLGDEIRPNNGVIITFYVESSAPHVHDRINRVKKIKQNQRQKKPRTAGSCGYDRRALLLAHAQELRKSHLPIHKLPQMKSRNWPERAETPARRRVCSPRKSQNNSQSQWRYRQVNTEKVDQPCCPKSCFTGRHKDAIVVGESISSFFKKLRVAGKELASRCKGHHEEGEERKALPMAAQRSTSFKAE